MKARIALTVIMILLYVGLFNVYIFNLTRINITTSKLFYNYLTAGAFIFLFLDVKAGLVNSYHRQFNWLLFLSILINYIIIILIHSHVLQPIHPKAIFYSFNLPVFIITLTIFVCEIRYKTFRD